MQITGLNSALCTTWSIVRKHKKKSWKNKCYENIFTKVGIVHLAVKMGCIESTSRAPKS